MALRDSSTYKHDVYLSFRGEDTRFSFTSHLTAALNQRGIRTFADDGVLLKGDGPSRSLLKAIQESRISIVIFSNNYAFSSWCLEELTAILDCYEEKKNNGSVVLPVFYEMDPSDVRHGRASYGEALAKHEERFVKEKVQKWRMALHNAANLSGFHFGKGGYEYKFIESIVKEICSMVSRVSSRVSLRVADYPVGLESRVDKVKSLLNLESDDLVQMVGIHGIGGIGKTTIALGVYNSIGGQFEGLCFLEDVRENSMKFGLIHLQEIVLSKICGDGDIDIQNVKQGISTMRKRLCRKKVLLVLDDVDKMEQLQAIAGASDWFGPGSRVIITTRDNNLLAKHDGGFGFGRTYEVEELSEKEALALLSWNAFKTDKAVDRSYAHVLNRALTYASRLPLALQVLGSYLFGKRIDEWNDALDEYEKIPDKNILRVLKISFDSLEEEERRIFCDIACFFNGHKLVEVEDILGAHYALSVKNSITVLIERSLIKIDDGLVTLHDLIQDMGREIVRQESPDVPGKRSRLWLPQDVVQVLQDKSGSNTVESLLLDFPKDGINSSGEEVNWDGEALKKMQNLKTLIIRNVRLNKGPTHLPNCLRVLEWSGYPSSSLPVGFHPKKLVILKLSESRLRISEPIQGFKSLTVLDFSYCEWITHISDVSGLPNLEKISLKHCESLTQIHESVGLLEKLRILDVVHCKKLSALPPIRLTSLEQLNLSHCSALESFPEILGKMENLTELHIMASPVKELPFSIQNLTRLRKLELHICGTIQLPSSIAMLAELSLMRVSKCQRLCLSKPDTGEKLESKSSKTEHLILSYCNISDDLLPIGLTWFSNVKDLDLSGNNFEILHASIKECLFLRNLKLDDCKNIQEIKGLPWKLESFSAQGCTSLKYLDFTGQCPSSIRELILDGCSFLKQVIGVLPNLESFSAKNCTSLSTSMFVNQESVEAGNKMFSLPGTKIPDWFTHRVNGGSISFWFRNKFPVISLCLVIESMGEQAITIKFSPRVFINGNKKSLGNRKVHEFRIATDHILLFDIRLLKFEDKEDVVYSYNSWNHVLVSYADHINNNGVPIKGVAKYSGIHVYEQYSSMANIRFNNPPQSLLSVNSNTNSMEAHQRGQIAAGRHQKDQTENLSSLILSSTQLEPAITDAKNGPGPKPTLPAKRSLEGVTREASGRLPEEDTHPTTISYIPPIIQNCRVGDDIEPEAVSSCELESEESSSSEGSDSDDPFDRVDRRLGISAKETISSASRSRDASFGSIKEAIRSLDGLMVKDLSEVSSDPDAQSGLGQLLDVLSTSSHPKVTFEVKEAIVEFKRKAFLSFQEFQSAAESVNKLKNFERHLDRIQQETLAGKGQRKDLKSSIKKVSLGIKSENRRKKELETEIATLRIHLSTKERDHEQLVLNLKNQEETHSTYSTSYASINHQAIALLKKADDLLAANSGVKHEGKAAEVKQSMLKSTWSFDLANLFNKIKNNIDTDLL
ncbi:TMV resistance protein N-like [Vicia villosa]|uniref:TMV resistance protein N-like n=1 Tax=Vicia villosa TaxID=3911 RepID=UPI00273C3164|nr:TMV resistance protein N-like [Vicia villosa]